MASEIRIPLVSVTRSEQDNEHTRLAYYVGETLLLDMEIRKEYIPSTGPLNEMALVQLLVTPHEHLALLENVLLLSKQAPPPQEGTQWADLLQKIEALLSPPK